MTAPNPKRARHIRVLSHQDLSPNLRRIVFHSPDLADYPFVCNGAHIKLLLPLPGQEVPVLPEATPQGPKWADKSTRPIGRTYTLRGYDRDACTISIDFVLHSDAGPAADFARNAAAGQTLGVSAPAGPSPMLKSAARYLFAGDLSALPAIGSMIEDMPATAAGDVLLWLPEEADLPALPLPEAVRLHTFFGGMEQAAPLIERFRSLRPAADSDTFVWIAGEAGMVAELRHSARRDWSLPAARCYAVPYWHHGEAEEAYHDKRHDFLDSED